VRFKTAVPVIVAGLLLMLVGIGQRTFWAPEEMVTASVQADARSAPVTVIDAGAKEPGLEDVDVTVRGDGKFTLAVGRAADVDAWVGDAAHLRVTGTAANTLETTFTDGEKTVPDARGSDLWTGEETVSGSVTHRWIDPAEGEWSILLVADGTAPAPTDISMTWPNEGATPWAIPLIVAGALVAVLGLALALMAPRNNGRRPPGRAAGSAARRRGSRGRQARRSRAARLRQALAQARPAFPAQTVAALRRGVMVGFLGLALGVAPATAAGTAAGTVAAPLAGSASPAGPDEDSGSYPVILDSQLQRILESVAETVQDADASAKADLLKPRAAQAAFEMRAANYRIRSEARGIAAPPPVAAVPVRASMIPSGSGWPRTVVALTQGEKNPVPQALVLVQGGPRSNYKLVSALQMLPGSTFPATASRGEVRPVPSDADDLTMIPRAAVNALAGALADPKGKRKDTFEPNSFAEAVTSFQDDVVADKNNKAAKISFRHKPEHQRTYGLYTGDGGAMVFGYLRNTYSSVPRKPGDSIDLDGTVYESLTGKESTTRGIDVHYAEAVMMYVPPADSGQKARVIGAAQELLGAKLR
jgi:hypothetical protein